MEAHRTLIEDDCELVYAWTVQHGFFSVPEPPAAVGLSPERLERALARLRDLQLVQPVGDGSIYSAVPPHHAVSRFANGYEAQLRAQEIELRRELAQLEEIHIAIDCFTPSYYQAVADREAGPIEVVTNGTDVQALLNTATAEATQSVMACQPGGARPQEELGRALPRDLALLARGVSLRSIYQHTAQFDGSTLAYVAKATAAGSRIRVATVMPTRLILIDGKVAFLPHQDHGAGAVIVREPSIVATLCAVFESMWQAATPMGEGKGSGEQDVALSDVDRQIVTFMAHGLTDKAIGVRLGMSERAVRSHVAKIYEYLGATSRFQAGVIAGQVGLVGGPRPAPGAPGVHRGA